VGQPILVSGDVDPGGGNGSNEFPRAGELQRPRASPSNDVGRDGDLNQPARG